jgi:hypothetical protein
MTFRTGSNWGTGERQGKCLNSLEELEVVFCEKGNRSALDELGAVMQTLERW